MGLMRESAAPSPARPGVVLVAQGLAKIYRMGTSEVHALRGVDLAVDAGEFIVLLGPSGSGKSTLLNILGGLDTPSAGHVRFVGHELTRAGEPELTRYRREHVGFVFQFYNLIPSLTARENVALVTDIAERPMAPEEALDWVGLAERLDHFPSQLSGGEQQRVAIARALVNEPDILLADEPTGNLDPDLTVEIMDLIASAATRGTTVLVATHELALVSRYGKRAVRLDAGRIAEDAPTGGGLR